MHDCRDPEQPAVCLLQHTRSKETTGANVIYQRCFISTTELCGNVVGSKRQILSLLNFVLAACSPTRGALGKS